MNINYLSYVSKQVHAFLDSPIESFSQNSIKDRISTTKAVAINTANIGRLTNVIISASTDIPNIDTNKALEYLVKYQEVLSAINKYIFTEKNQNSSHENLLAQTQASATIIGAQVANFLPELANVLQLSDLEQLQKQLILTNNFASTDFVIHGKKLQSSANAVIIEKLEVSEDRDNTKIRTNSLTINILSSNIKSSLAKLLLALAENRSASRHTFNITQDRLHSKIKLQQSYKLKLSERKAQLEFNILGKLLAKLSSSFNLEQLSILENEFNLNADSENESRDLLPPQILFQIPPPLGSIVIWMRKLRTRLSKKRLERLERALTAGVFLIEEGLDPEEEPISGPKLTSSIQGSI